MPPAHQQQKRLLLLLKFLVTTEGLSGGPPMRTVYYVAEEDPAKSFQEADERLAGRPAPDFVTRMCNRFWIGRAELAEGP